MKMLQEFIIWGDVMKRLKLNIQFFAGSGSKSVRVDSSGSNYGTLSVSWSEDSNYNTANNTSKISLGASLYANTGSWSNISTPTLVLYWYDNRSNTDIEIAKQEVKTMSKRGTVSISGDYIATHRDDGSLRGYAKAVWIYDGKSSYVYKSGTATTDEVDCNTIPRKTSCPSISGNVAEVTTIKLSPASNSFTHTITYSFGSLSGTIATKTNLTSINWTMPTSFYAQIGSTGKNKKGTLTVTTYSGSTVVGSTSAEFTANVKESLAKLTITGVSFKDVNSNTTALTGNSNKIVANASTMRIAYKVSSPSGATITSLTVGGVKVENNSTYRDIVKPNANNTIKIVAVDSRGYTTTYESSVAAANWISYKPLTISANAVRPDAISGKATLGGSGNYWTGNFGSVANALTVKYRYKLKTDTNYSNWITLNTTINSSANTYSINSISPTGFDVNKVYDIQFIAIDKINTNGVPYNLILNKALPIAWWNGTTFNVNGTINSTSLESRKKDIKDFNGALEAVINSDIRLFSYKWEEEGQQHIGFIIPDLGGDYKLPEVVINENKDGIELYTMCSLLWKAVQEQQKEIEELKKSSFFNIKGE